MKDKNPNMRLVSSKEKPAEPVEPDPLFADYGPVDGRRPIKSKAVGRWPSRVEPFTQLPDSVWLKLYEKKVGDAAWACAMELERLVFRRHENPVRFFSPKLNGLGLVQHTRSGALRRLEAAGFIRIEQTKRGSSPLVACLWRPLTW